MRRGPANVEKWETTAGTSSVIRLNGLAEGRWHVIAKGHDPEGAAYEGTADADAGGAVEIRLEPVKK